MSSDPQVRKPAQLQQLASEFLGTFLLTFVVGLNLTECDRQSEFGPIACGCCLMVLVYAFGPVSGAHLNPAVSFAVLLQDGYDSDEVHWKVALKYVVAQCGGGALAGLATGFMVGFEQSGAHLGPEKVSGILFSAPLAEFLYTFLLCFVVLNVAVAYDAADDQQQSSSVDGDESGVKPPRSPPPSGYGVAIGFVLIAAKAIGGVSGAALNPAVTIGINFMGPSWKTLYVPVYIVFQLMGGFAATTALHIVRPLSRKTIDRHVGFPKWFTDKAYYLESLFDPEDTAEFLGTFFVCLTISLCTMSQQTTAVWSIGACFMCVIYALGDVSGGVFNPALTLAFSVRWYGTGAGFGDEKLCDPKKSMKEWVKYFIAQMIGGAAGTGVTLLIYFLMETTVSSETKMPDLQTACSINVSTGAPLMDESGTQCVRHTLAQAFFAEIFGTFFLCFVVLAVASVKNPLQHYGAFCVGSCIIGAGYSFGSISGGLLNPAVTLCNSIGTLQFFQSAIPHAYVGAQCLGGILAGVSFRFLTHTHEMEQLEKDADGNPLQQPLKDGV